MSNSEPFRPAVVLFGMRCAFTMPPVRALIDAGIDLRAIVLPGRKGDPPVVREPGRTNRVRVPMAGAEPVVGDLAAAAGVPLLRVHGLGDQEARVAIAEFAPDVTAVACFPWRIPSSIRGLAKHAALNVHPSLLPRWRGPDPLFWTFAAGDSESGVTVHHLADTFDGGAIVAQRAIPVPAGVDGRGFERTLAEVGGELLVDAIARIGRREMLPADPQSESEATAAPLPSETDLTFSTDLPARRLFNAIRGIAPLWGPVTLLVAATDERIQVRHALHVEPEQDQTAAVVHEGNRATIRCNPGLLTVLAER